MGALSPLNNTSMSIEFLPTPSEIDHGQDYSAFSDYLSPLSQNAAPEQEPSPNSLENTSDQEGHEDAKEFKLFASSKESEPSKKTHLFADKSLRPDATNDEKQSAKAAKDKQAAVTLTKKPANSESGAEATKAKHAQQAIQAEESFEALKKNVKHILNNIPSAANKTVATKGSHPLPKGASIRVEPSNAAHLAKVKAQKGRANDAQTTMAHLKVRNKQASINQSNNEAVHEASTDPQKKNPKAIADGSRPGAEHLLKANKQEMVLNPVIKKSRTAKKGRAEQHSAINKIQKQASQKQSTLPQFIPLDKINESQANPTGIAEKAEITAKRMDASHTDAEANPNQLGKGTERTSQQKSAVAKTQYTTRASRATNWLKVLSERTSLLDKSNPQWKVLEMKLDKGNGSMTVRVMKEDDHVSVAVNFSDPEVKALAESQYNNILQDLENQYQQEVKFTFNEHRHSGFESFASYKPLKPMGQTNIQPIQRQSQEVNTDIMHSSSEKNVWIG